MRTFRDLVGLESNAKDITYSIAEASALMDQTGFKIKHVLRVFSSDLPNADRIKDKDNCFEIENKVYENLDRTTIENLHCPRFFFVGQLR